MGRTTEKVKIANFGDQLKAAEGIIKHSDIRTAEVEAIVDTGATYLCLPPEVIQRLGLVFHTEVVVATANGYVTRRLYLGAKAEIQGRSTLVTVMENDLKTPPLIGYILLEELDFVVDAKTKKIIPNPVHEGKWVADLY